jgi:hypothetical protein
VAAAQRELIFMMRYRRIHWGRFTPDVAWSVLLRTRSAWCIIGLSGPSCSLCPMMRKARPQSYLPGLLFGVRIAHNTSQLPEAVALQVTPARG